MTPRSDSRQSCSRSAEFAVGQTWGRGRSRITITRLARRTVFGPYTISGIPLTVKGQVRYTQLRAKWELIDHV